MWIYHLFAKGESFKLLRIEKIKLKVRKLTEMGPVVFSPRGLRIVMCPLPVKPIEETKENRFFSKYVDNVSSIKKRREKNRKTISQDLYNSRGTIMTNCV